MVSGQEDYTKTSITNLSDVSLAKLDELISTIARAQVVVEGGTEDYTDTTNNAAWKEAWPEYPPTTAPRETGSVFTSANYVEVSVLNNIGVSKGFTLYAYAAQIFRITKPVTALDSAILNITFRGLMAKTFGQTTANLYVYIWNNDSSAWEAFNNHIAVVDSWKTLTKEIADGTDYIDGSDRIYILAVTDDYYGGLLGEGAPYVWTDYISIDFATGYYYKTIVYV